MNARTMKTLTLIFASLGILISCSLKQTEPDVKLPLAKLKEAQKERINQALVEFDDGAGRLAPILTDCDGMIWQGKWCAITGCSLADYQGAPGEFFRRPEPRCWTQEGGSAGAATTWSRDMGICGLIPYSVLRGKRTYLEEHQTYGKEHDWYLGEPKADGRAYYTPAMRSVLAKAVHFLGGAKDKDAYWPNVYPSGLSDFQAHLQVCNIWLRAHIEGKFHSMLLDRVYEHHKRLPDDPFYSSVYAILSGKTEKAIANCLEKEPYYGDYVRCGKHPRACGFANHVFGCQLLIDAYD